MKNKKDLEKYLSDCDKLSKLNKQAEDLSVKLDGLAKAIPDPGDEDKSGLTAKEIDSLCSVYNKTKASLLAVKLAANAVEKKVLLQEAEDLLSD